MLVFTPTKGWALGPLRVTLEGPPWGPSLWGTAEPPRPEEPPRDNRKPASGLRIGSL